MNVSKDGDQVELSCTASCTNTSENCPSKIIYIPTITPTQFTLIYLIRIQTDVHKRLVHEHIKRLCS